MYYNASGFAKKDTRFWNQMAPNLVEYIKFQNKLLRPWPRQIPLLQENVHRSGLLGTAIDFLSGLLLQGEIENTIGSRVVRCETFIKAQGADPRHAYDFYCAVTSEPFTGFDNNLPVTSWHEPRLLGMAMLSLAQVEVVMRSALAKYLPPFASLPRRLTVSSAAKWMARHVDSHLVDEWLLLAESLRMLLRELPSGRVIYNPDFVARGNIGGSDADLVVDSTLFDIKTIVDAGLKSYYIRQLLTYLALNRLKGTVPPIDRLGIIAPRQGYVWHDSLSNICRDIGAINPSSVTRSIDERLKDSDPLNQPARIQPISWCRPDIRLAELRYFFRFRHNSKIEANRCLAQFASRNEVTVPISQ